MDSFADFRLFRDLSVISKKKRKINDYSTIDVISKYSDEEFRERFRMNKNTFNDLLDEIRGSLDKENNRGRPIPPEIQLMVTLRYFATGTFQQVDGDLIGMAQTTVSDVISRTAEAIAKMRPRYIAFPRADQCAD